MLQVDHRQAQDVAVDARQAAKAPALHHAIEPGIHGLALAQHLPGPLQGTTAHVVLVGEQQQARQLQAGRQPIQGLLRLGDALLQMPAHLRQAGLAAVLQLAVEQLLLGALQILSGETGSLVQDLAMAQRQLTEVAVSRVARDADARCAEWLLRHAEPGEMLGELALFDGQPRSADATAVGAVTGQVLTRADFRRIAAAHPALYDAALAHLAAMLRGTTEQLESIALYQLQARVARFFLAAFRALHGEDIPDGAALDLRISQGELAALTGASRPKVNRVLADLKAAGALDQDGATWRCDPAALEALAGDDA